VSNEILSSPTSGKATIRDVAKLAGVSEATVSYIVSGRRGGHSRISEATRQRVQAAAAELGYMPNSAARILRRQRTDRIVVTMPIITPYHTILVQQLQQAADAFGYFTMVAVAGSEERELKTVDQLRRGLADAAVIKDARFLCTDHFRQLAATGLALVVMDDVTEPDGFDVARLREEQACEHAVDMLRDRGHTRFAIFGDRSNVFGARKIDRYINLLREAGYTDSDFTVFGSVEGRRDAYNAVLEMIALEQRPTAVLAVTDRGAIGALLGARHAGLSVPGDLAIVGIGNIPETEITTPPLTTIGLRDMDFSGVAELLFDRMTASEPPPGRTQWLEVDLIQRGSA
jgi:DNA-binding LacI/PurR family transcriptional regulator